MNPIVTTRGPFAVLGVVARIRRGSETSDLFAGIWASFESRRPAIQAVSVEKSYYGVSFPTGQEGVTDYLAGMAVPDDAGTVGDLVSRTVPGGQFAVFECPVQAIGETYQHIFGAWLPVAPFEFDGTLASFEEYPENTETEPVRIHIPVRKRNQRSKGAG
jgi:predicted transcriptional regulator YdeE